MSDSHVAFQHGKCDRFLPTPSTGNMSPDSEVPYGTLDLMVLKTLAAMGSLHGYGIARRIEQAAAGALALNQGTTYPALLRLGQRAWTRTAWGTGNNNGRPRSTPITAAGRGKPAK